MSLALRRKVSQATPVGAPRGGLLIHIPPDAERRVPGVLWAVGAILWMRPHAAALAAPEAGP
jgi:hypothetical protein